MFDQFHKFPTLSVTCGSMTWMLEHKKKHVLSLRVYWKDDFFFSENKFEIMPKSGVVTLFLSKCAPPLCVRGRTPQVLAELLFGSSRLDHCMRSNSHTPQWYVSVLAAGSFVPIINRLAIDSQLSFSQLRDKLVSVDPGTQWAELFRKHDTTFERECRDDELVCHTNPDVGLDRNGCHHIEIVIVKRDWWPHVKSFDAFDVKSCALLVWNPVRQGIFAICVYSLTSQLRKSGHLQSVCIYHADDAERLFEVKTSFACVQCIRWHPHGELLLFTTYPSSLTNRKSPMVFIWNTVKKKLVHQLPFSDGAYVDWDSTGELLAVCVHDSVAFLDREYRTVVVFDTPANSKVSWHPTKPYLCVTTYVRVRFIDTTVLPNIQYVKGDFVNPLGNIRSIHWRPDASQLCVRTKGTSLVVIWNAETFKPTHAIECPNFFQMCWHPTLPIIAVKDHPLDEQTSIVYLGPPCDLHNLIEMWTDSDNVLCRSIDTGDSTVCMGWDATGSIFAAGCIDQLRMWTRFK